MAQRFSYISRVELCQRVRVDARIDFGGEPKPIKDQPIPNNVSCACGGRPIRLAHRTLLSPSNVFRKMPVMSMPLRASALAAALAVVRLSATSATCTTSTRCVGSFAFSLFPRENHSSEPDRYPLPLASQDVSSAEVFSSDVTTCREYKDEACCTADTAKGYVLSRIRRLDTQIILPTCRAWG